jgi:aryl-alcohol dehydrogenase-like predicted oxidoreductase
VYVATLCYSTGRGLKSTLVHKMQNYAKAHGLTEFVSMQNYHNAIYREEEREMVPLLQDLGVGMIPWSPLARGFLTRPLNEETVRTGSDG